jgi:AI-2 transport protein TqsA
MFSNEENKNHVFEIIDKIKNDIKSYFVIKTVVSFITALASYLVMLAFGLDFAPFWAFVVFVLNYIPNI